MRGNPLVEHRTPLMVAYLSKVNMKSTERNDMKRIFLVNREVLQQQRVDVGLSRNKLGPEGNVELVLALL